MIRTLTLTDEEVDMILDALEQQALHLDRIASEPHSISSSTRREWLEKMKVIEAFAAKIANRVV